MPKFYFDSVEVGDPVTPLTKPPVTRVQIARFAGASLDYSPLHIDDDFAKAAGYGGVFAHGAISLGFAVEAISRWLENGRILSSTATFQKLVWPGDILTAKGVIVRRAEINGEPRVEVDVWAENQNHDIVMKGSITCILWLDEKHEKKTKGSWPPISATTLSLAKKGSTPTGVGDDEEEEEEEEVPVKKPAPKKKATPVAKPPAQAAKKAAVKTAKKTPAAKKAPAKKAAPKKTAKKAPAKKTTKKPAKKTAKKAAPKKATKKRR